MKYNFTNNNNKLIDLLDIQIKNNGNSKWNEKERGIDHNNKGI